MAKKKIKPKYASLDHVPKGGYSKNQKRKILRDHLPRTKRGKSK